MSQIEIIQDMDRAIEILHNAGVWLQESGMKPSKWWKPKNMNHTFLLQYTEPDEYYVAMVDGKPAATMVLQDTERVQSWKAVDGDKPIKALYVHWLCVHRDFAGQGYPQKMIVFASKEAKKRRASLLRLDANAREKKLCRIYENLGFTLAGTEDDGKAMTAFYQKMVSKES